MTASDERVGGMWRGRRGVFLVAGGCAVGEAAAGTSLLPGGKTAAAGDWGQGRRCWADVEAATAGRVAGKMGGGCGDRGGGGRGLLVGGGEGRPMYHKRAGPGTGVGEQARVRRVSAPTQIRLKNGPGMGRPRTKNEPRPFGLARWAAFSVRADPNGWPRTKWVAPLELLIAPTTTTRLVVH